MNWQPIETAPKDGTWVMLYGKESWTEQDDKVQPIVVGFWNASSRYKEDWGWAFCFWDSDWRSTFDATHWMPLPEPPQSLSANASADSL